MLVLDTDHVSLLQWGAGEPAQCLRMRLQAASEPVAVTIVSYEEQTRGWLAYVARAKTLSQQVEAYRRLKRHLEVYRTVQLLDFDEPAATEFQRLKHARLGVGTMDLRIAAIALIHDATVLTRNAVDSRLSHDANVPCQSQLRITRAGAYVRLPGGFFSNTRQGF